MPDSSKNGSRQVKWGQTFVTRLGISRLASLEKPSVFLGHGLRPMTPNKKAPPHASMDEAFYI